MKISRAEARALADKELQPHRRPDLELVFAEEMTEEVEEGWVFFWKDRRHLEGDLAFALGGNGPIFVSKTGYVGMVWSGENWTTAVERFRAQGTTNPW